MACVNRRRECADWRLAPASERFDEGALRPECRRGRGIFDGRHRPLDELIALSNFDGDNALSGRRHAGRRWHRHGNPRSESQAPESGGGQHDGIMGALVQLAQARVEVAANGREPRVREQPRQLRDSPYAAGAE